MPIPMPYLPAAYSLTAMGTWGVSDFIGGVGSRRANAFLFAAIGHIAAMSLMSGAALLTRASFPGRASVLWALLAGSVGGIALALFYRALASGKMGLTAPVAAVLGAAIPAIATAFTEGFPGPRRLLGFVLAVVGVWLISRVENGAGRPEGLALAVISGCGFAAFYLCIHQTGDASALWIAVISRCASLLVTLALVLVGRNLRTVSAHVLGIAILAGCLDISGSALFVRAQQAGRLDAAVVLSSLYPAITVLLARIFLHEHFSRARTVGMLAALLSVPMIAA
jgi:drug/metabolite transporter (DMT)-like permease